MAVKDVETQSNSEETTGFQVSDKIKGIDENPVPKQTEIPETISLYNQAKQRGSLDSSSHRSRPKGGFMVVQHWEGIVNEIDHDEKQVNAVLKDLSGGDSEEEVEFDYMDFSSDEDIEDLQKGSVFDWYIGYETSPAGTRSIKSIINVKRLGKWTTSQIDKAADKANEIKGWLNGEGK